jgi:hypothetical protein
MTRKEDTGSLPEERRPLKQGLNLAKVEDASHPQNKGETAVVYCDPFFICQYFVCAQLREGLWINNPGAASSTLFVSEKVPIFSLSKKNLTRFDIIN